MALGREEGGSRKASEQEEVSIFEIAEEIMYEYKFQSIEEVLKMFTFAQIGRILELIMKRKKSEYVMLINIYHTSKPNKLISDLTFEERLEDYKKYKEGKK